MREKVVSVRNFFTPPSSSMASTASSSSYKAQYCWWILNKALTTNEIRSDINSESTVKDPEVGMTFPSWDAVDSYYHAYGKQRGFGVIRAAGKPDKRRVSKGKRVVVQSPIQRSPTNKTTSSKKCECPAMHKNHTPTPSKSWHIPKYRNEELNKSNVARNLFNANAAGVSIAKIHRTLVMERNGFENLGVSERDAQFRDVYTDAKFKEVQVQCSRVLYVTPLEKRVVGDNVVEHLLEDIVYTRTKKKREEIATMKRRTYCVWFDIASHDSGCECKHFECYGIMCRHLIKVYYMYNVEHVPSKFILRRWRKDIQRKHMVVKVAYHDLSKTAQVQRFDKLMVEFERVCLKASLLDVNIHTCMELIQLMDLRVEENNTKFYESARAGHPSSVTPESTSNGAAVTSASANRSLNYEVFPGGTPNPDQSTPCQGSTMRTQNETASTSKGTTSHSVGDPVLWRKKKGSKGGVNETGLPMFGVGYRPGVVAQRLFADDPPLVQPLRQLCPTEPLFGCQVSNGNHQWFPPHPHNDGHYQCQPERVLHNTNILSSETVQKLSHPHTGFGSEVPWRGGSNEQQVSHPHTDIGL
ncbi:Protein FAR1-RELATED SEQUENCE 2 [Bienertia sinuspersici]